MVLFQQQTPPNKTIRIITCCLEGALVIMGRGGAIGLLASQFLDSKREQIQSKAVGILALLSAMKDNKDLFPDADAICGLVPLVDSLDEETKKGALTALANLADHGNISSSRFQL